MVTGALLSLGLADTSDDFMGSDAVAVLNWIDVLVLALGTTGLVDFNLVGAFVGVLSAVGICGRGVVRKTSCVA